MSTKKKPQKPPPVRPAPALADRDRPGRVVSIVRDLPPRLALVCGNDTTVVNYPHATDSGDIQPGQHVEALGRLIRAAVNFHAGRTDLALFAAEARIRLLLPDSDGGWKSVTEHDLYTVFALAGGPAEGQG